MEEINDQSAPEPIKRKRRKLIAYETPEEEISDAERKYREELVREGMKRHEAYKAQMRRQKRGRIFFIVLKIIVSTALILATEIAFPYGYYTFLRWLVCGSAALYAYFEYKKPKPSGWLIASFLVAILFNPFIPVYLSRSSWRPIDYSLVAIILISLLFDFKKTKK